MCYSNDASRSNAASLTRPSTLSGSDWEIRSFTNAYEAPLSQRIIHRELEQFRIYGNYIRNTMFQMMRRMTGWSICRCSYPIHSGSLARDLRDDRAFFPIPDKNLRDEIEEWF